MSNNVFVPPLPMAGEIEAIRLSKSQEHLMTFSSMLYIRCQIQNLLGRQFSPNTRKVLLSNQEYAEMMAKVGVFLAKAEKMPIDSLKNLVSFYYRQSLFYQQKNGIAQ